MTTTNSSHHRRFALFALLSFAYAWFSLWSIGTDDPWYRNADMNILNMADALSLNAGQSLGVVDQPAATTKYLLALDYRLRNALGQLHVWHTKRLGRSESPLEELPSLVRIERLHSRIVVMLTILIAAVFVGHVTGRLDCGCLAVMLLCGSSGLLFHGLLLRPELLCAGFGGVLATYAAWLATRTTSGLARAWWLLLAGAACGLALLSKLPALFYLLLIVGWCWFTSFGEAREASPPSASTASTRWVAALGLIAAASALLLLSLLQQLNASLDATAINRIRLCATATAFLPLAGWIRLSSPSLRYVCARGLDGATLLAGSLLTIFGWFGLLVLIMPLEPAGLYMAKLLNAVFHPEPLVNSFTVSGALHQLREMGRFFMETPLLFLATMVLAITHTLLPAPRAWARPLVLLLFVQGLGMACLLSRRQFTDQYSIMVQVPFLLIWPIALGSMHELWRRRAPASEQSWPVKLALAGAFLFVLASPAELRPKYRHYQDDAHVPVSDLCVTYLYDYRAHSPAYLAAMKQRYPTRGEFTRRLNEFLDQLPNRY